MPTDVNLPFHRGREYRGIRDRVIGYYDALSQAIEDYFLASLLRTVMVEVPWQGVQVRVRQASCS